MPVIAVAEHAADHIDIFRMEGIEQIAGFVDLGIAVEGGADDVHIFHRAVATYIRSVVIRQQSACAGIGGALQHGAGQEQQGLIGIETQASIQAVDTCREDHRAAVLHRVNGRLQFGRVKFRIVRFGTVIQYIHHRARGFIQDPRLLGGGKHAGAGKIHRFPEGQLQGGFIQPRYIPLDALGRLRIPVSFQADFRAGKYRIAGAHTAGQEQKPILCAKICPFPKFQDIAAGQLFRHADKEAAFPDRILFIPQGLSEQGCFDAVKIIIHADTHAVVRRHDAAAASREQVFRHIHIADTAAKGDRRLGAVTAQEGAAMDADVAVATVLMVAQGDRISSLLGIEAAAADHHIRASRLIRLVGQAIKQTFLPRRADVQIFRHGIGILEGIFKGAA